MSAPATWAGTLNANEVFTSIKNMIISQYVYSDNISSQAYRSLVNRFREEGTLFGDTKLYYATDILKTKPFVLDSVNQLNLLAVDRPKDPHVQAIVLDQFRYIEVTLDEYFTKRAFSSASVFADYNGQMLSWLRETKEVYDETTFNTYVGTVETSEGNQQQVADVASITAVSTTIDEEAKNRLVAETIGKTIQDIFTGLKDVSRDWNDLHYTRKYDPSDFIVVWNAKYANFMRNVALPTIFHKDGILEIKDENILPARYFGEVNGSSGSASGSNTTIRFMKETEVDGVDYWAGDLTPNSYAYAAGETYTENSGLLTDGAVVCKIIHKGAIPYMSGYMTQKEFINPKNLSNNHYLHFAHNTLQYLYNYPLITVKINTSN